MKAKQGGWWEEREAEAVGGLTGDIAGHEAPRELLQPRHGLPGPAPHS